MKIATIGSVMSICRSVWDNSAPTGQIPWNSIFEDVSKISRENSSVFKTGQEQRVLCFKTYVYLRIFPIITGLIILRTRNVLGRSYRGNQNMRFMFRNFFTKIVPFMRWCGKIWYSQGGHRWKYRTARVATGENIVQPRWPQVKIWYSQGGHRWKYGTAKVATGENIVQPRWPQVKIWYSQGGHRWKYRTAKVATGENIVQPRWPQVKIWYSQGGHRWKYGTAKVATSENRICRMRFVCWITEAICTHSEYVIVIAFPW